jgi:DNA-binding transcriptional LysR family regulator
MAFDLRLLRYFVVLAETLHFGRAAARLAISQPPLSRQIHTLEQDLGAELFVRGARGVRLTPAGEALLPHARRLLREADALAAGAKELGRGEVGVVRLGFISTAAYNVLPRVLPEFRRRHPGIRLSLVESTSDAQFTGLRDDTLDVGLVIPPVLEALQYAPLLHEPLIAALPASRRWPRPLPLARLAAEPFILFPRRSSQGLYDLIVGLCASAGFAPRIEQEAIQMPTIVSLVAAGIGVALVPASVAKMRRTDVVYRRLAEPGPPMEVGLAWNEASQTPAVAAFVAHVRSVFTPGKR